MRKMWLKFVLGTIGIMAALKLYNNQQEIQSAFSSVEEFIAASFGLIVSGTIFGSIAFGIWRISHRKK